MSSSSQHPNLQSGSYQKVESNKPTPDGMKIISEGTASILYGQEGEAFYNKVQVMNRDLSILVLKTFNQIRQEEFTKFSGEKRKGDEKSHTSKEANVNIPDKVRGLKILEALSATGLRSVRYWKEIENVDSIIANDLSTEAVDCIKRNIEYNEIPESCIIPNCQDATELMYLSRTSEKQFDVVDLDPYGSAVIFLDGAVQSVKDGGLLCVTCTDLAVLAGSNPSACFARYGSFPAKISAIHEMALRTLLQTVSTSANRYRKVIVPVLACYINFYVRVFFRVYNSAKEVNASHEKIGHILHCGSCSAQYSQPLSKHRGNAVNNNYLVHGNECEECGGQLKIGGPFWLDKIHDREFIAKALHYLDQNTSKFTMHKEIKGLLTLCQEELPNVPFFYSHSDVASKFKMSCPSFGAVKSALANAGYQVSRAHCDPAGYKTTAPITIVHDVYRAWHATHHKKESTSEPAEKSEKIKGANDAKTIARNLLSKAPSIEVDFTLRPEEERPALFFQNPEENWGPKKAARITTKKPSSPSNHSSDEQQASSSSESPEAKKRRTQ